MSRWAGLQSLCVLSCRGLRIAAVRHLKNAGGRGPQVRGRKWCHAVHCCPVLFVWQPHCSEGLPTGWELMGPALHCLFPRPLRTVHYISSQCLFSAIPGFPIRMKTLLGLSFLARNMLEDHRLDLKTIDKIWDILKILLKEWFPICGSESSQGVTW